MGVIVAINSDGTWSTVEGGASDHVTRAKTRKLVSSQGSSWGKFAFDGDANATSAGVRPLQGWYSVDKVDPTRWM